MSTDEPSVGSTAPFHKHHGSLNRPNSATPSVMAYSNHSWITQGTAKTGGQIFLCAIGGMISASIGLWLAVFSDDIQWRRFLFASLALVCALLFALLAFITARHITHTHARRASQIGSRLRRQTTTSSSRTVRGNSCKRPGESGIMIDRAHEVVNDQHGLPQINQGNHHHHAHFDDLPDRPKHDV
uniref:Uncharacterized protein n=1 Tax=Plectus sambesii TaxID=2011161 RepID=A0A914V4B6_9BILA